MARLTVEIDSYPGPRDQWIDRPRVVDADTGRVVLDLTDTDWDAKPQRVDGPYAVLDLRRWPGRPRCVLAIDADAMTYALSHHDPPGSGEDLAHAAFAWGLTRGEVAVAVRPPWWERLGG